ncbi:hypothetical protein AB833_00660 [Chromatiales bacterium (ex Bugula neritina AB1)]|nr:hypothetical protein AB833_00660 [Chromatiales bacterium (ex Bugula neritina AB1)]
MAFSLCWWTVSFFDRIKNLQGPSNELGVAVAIGIIQTALSEDQQSGRLPIVGMGRIGDLDRYAVHRPNNGDNQALVKSCKQHRTAMV